MALREALTSASLIFLPTTSRSRSRRITSTSGSSISAPLDRCGLAWDQPFRDPRVRLARGLLLGLLLRPPPSASERLTSDVDRGRELLLVVGSLLLDPIVGHSAE